MIKQNNKLTELALWIADFPCEKYFETKNICILEFITVEDFYQFIEKKINHGQKRKR